MNIYSRKAFYQRMIGFLEEFKPPAHLKQRISVTRILALFRSMLYIGILDKGSIYYWRLFLWSLFKRPRVFPMAITYSIYGYHFRKVYRIDN